MTPTKVCFKCDRRKPLDDFYKHKMMADGHLGKCKACTKRDVSKNYRDRIDQYREYEKKRAQSPHRKYARFGGAKPKYVRKRSPETPAKRRARTAVGNAVRDGRLIKGPCEVCGSTVRIHGHHDDYRRPLSVRWLCPKHHAEHHFAIQPD